MSSIVNLFRLRPRKQDRFEELLRPHIELLYRMAFRWTQSQHRAEDLVQDVLVRLVSQVDAMEQVENLQPWLVRIVYNRYVDLYRRQRNSPIDERHSGWAPEDEEETAANDPISQAVDNRDDFAQLELQQSLSRALAQLEPEQRDLVLLQDMEGYSAEEAAEILQINLGTAKSRLHRARAKLRELLRDELQVDDQGAAPAHYTSPTTGHPSHDEPNSSGRDP